MLRIYSLPSRRLASSSFSDSENRDSREHALSNIGIPIEVIKSQVAAAKEVGMGNPAEKNDRSPDSSIAGDHLPQVARTFFRKVGTQPP